MSVHLKRIAVLVLVVSVTVVFISPIVDLEPTAMRAARAAQLMMLALTAGVAVILALLMPTNCAASSSPSRTEFHGSTDDILDVDCARLC